MNVEQVWVVPKNPKRLITSDNTNQHEQSEQQNASNHEIFKVEVGCGKIYALDLTGAQFGYYEPLTPWEDYLRKRVKKMGEHDRHRMYGGLKAYNKHKGQADHPEMIKIRKINGLNSLASEKLDQIAREWKEMKELSSFREMMELPQEDFRGMKGQLLREVEVELKDFVIHIKRNNDLLEEVYGVTGPMMPL